MLTLTIGWSDPLWQAEHLPQPASRPYVRLAAWLLTRMEGAGSAGCSFMIQLASTWQSAASCQQKVAAGQGSGQGVSRRGGLPVGMVWLQLEVCEVSHSTPGPPITKCVSVGLVRLVGKGVQALHIWRVALGIFELLFSQTNELQVTLRKPWRGQQAPAKDMQLWTDQGTVTAVLLDKERLVKVDAGPSLRIP